MNKAAEVFNSLMEYVRAIWDFLKVVMKIVLVIAIIFAAVAFAYDIIKSVVSPKPAREATPQQLSDAAEFPVGRFRSFSLRNHGNIVIDTQTGCRYLRASSGVTPLLTQEGKPDCRPAN